MFKAPTGTTGIGLEARGHGMALAVVSITQHLFCFVFVSLK